MKTVRIISVGKLKKGFWADASQFYLERILRSLPVDRIVLKDGPSHLPIPSRIQHESEALLSRISGQDYVLCLDVQGKRFTSEEFAARLQAWIEDPQFTPCFLVGGAYGVSRAVRQRSNLLLSFGPMTFPHEMAQVLLLEQLYRAITINQGLPYHH